MTNNTCITNHERSIELSVAPPTLDNTQSVHFQVATQKVSDLRDIFTNHNYSPIIWANGYRKKINFRSASAFCLDIDAGMTLETAKEILSRSKLNYALITTKSHTPKAHRFRVLVPFNRKLHTLEQYETVARRINEIFGNQCDPAVFDGARFSTFSPEDALFFSDFTSTDFDVTPFTGIDLSAVRYGRGDWTDSLEIKDVTNRLLNLKDVKQKTRILCPFHEDSTSSAFLEFSENSKNWFIYCSACNKSYWKTKVIAPIEDRCKPFWSHSKNIYEAGIAETGFYFKEINERKFDIFIEAYEETERQKAYQWLVENKHISTVARIDQVGDAFTETTDYRVYKETGIVEVRYAPLKPDLKDNEFIENYLKATFKEQKDFIKQYLAAYVYTNFKKLPTLVLVGPRNSGKNTFAELVAEIYKPLSTPWEVKKSEFNPAFEKKLLIADETVTKKAEDYVELKRISGQGSHTVNKKFTPQYLVRNNINVIILSNKLLPVFVESSELPKSTKLNQFFVYEFKPMQGEIDSELADKLKRRLGHYIRTELRRVFDRINMDQYRYGMEVPITDEERRLFNCSVSADDDLCERFIQKLVEHMEKTQWTPMDHIVEGEIPTGVFGEFGFSDIEKRTIIKRLREGKLLSDEPTTKGKLINENRPYIYKMNEELMRRIEIDLGVACFACLPRYEQAA